MFQKHGADFTLPTVNLYEAVKSNHNEIVAWLLQRVDEQFWDKEKANSALRPPSVETINKEEEAQQAEKFLSRHPSLVRVIANNAVQARMLDLLLNTFPAEMDALIAIGKMTTA